MTEEVSFNSIMDMNDREIEARRALFESARIRRLAVHLYLAYMDKSSVVAFLDLDIAEQDRWHRVASAAVGSIKGGMYGAR